MSRTNNRVVTTKAFMKKAEEAIRVNDEISKSVEDLCDWLDSNLTDEQKENLSKHLDLGR